MESVTIWLLAMALGAALALAAQYVLRRRAEERDVAAWVQVANMNTLLRLDLDHLTGNDDNHALREARAALKALAASRAPAERALLERYGNLVGIAIGFGERVFGASATAPQAVANRRAHVQNALAVGDQIEAALGGITELAKCANDDRRERVRQSYHTAALDLTRSAA